MRPALVAVHLDGRHDRLAQGAVVVRVDEHGVGQLVGRAGELGQHEHAVAVEAGRHVLLGDEVHAVAQRRHQHHVAGAVEGDELVERQRLVEVVDRRVAEPAVHAVDLADELLDLVALVLVVLDALAVGVATCTITQRSASSVPSSSSDW